MHPPLLIFQLASLTTILALIQNITSPPGNQMVSSVACQQHRSRSLTVAINKH